MRKHQAETAIAVYHGDIVPTLTGRQSFVVDALVRYERQHRQDPTALELLEETRSWYPFGRPRRELDSPAADGVGDGGAGGEGGEAPLPGVG